MILAASSEILSHNLGRQASRFWGDPVVQCPLETRLKCCYLGLVVFVFVGGFLGRRPKTLQGPRYLFNVIRLKSRGAVELVMEKFVDCTERQILGGGEKPAPLRPNGLAFVGIGILVELCRRFLEGSVLVGHVLVEVAAQKTTERGKTRRRDFRVIFWCRLSCHARHSG